jgi:hypothetical protein
VDADTNEEHPPLTKEWEEIERETERTGMGRGRGRGGRKCLEISWTLSMRPVTWSDGKSCEEIQSDGF